mgnify:FL=1
MESIHATPDQPERPLTRQQREEDLAKRKRGIHMMKDAIKMKNLRNDYQDFKEFCKAEKRRLKVDETQATDQLDRLALVTEGKNCEKAIVTADAALLAIQNRVDDILNPNPNPKPKPKPEVEVEVEAKPDEEA